MDENTLKPIAEFAAAHPIMFMIVAIIYGLPKVFVSFQSLWTTFKCGCKSNKDKSNQ